MDAARLMGKRTDGKVVYDPSAFVPRAMVTGMRILVIAGPNGAGKTTFAMQYLPNEANCPAFVNGDLIASGLSPFRPELRAARAGRQACGNEIPEKHAD